MFGFKKRGGLFRILKCFIPAPSLLNGAHTARLCLRAVALQIKEAVEAVGTRDRWAIAASLPSIDLTGGSARFFSGGRIKLDEKGRRAGARLLVIKWQEGVPKTVYPPEAAVAKPIWPK